MNTKWRSVEYNKNPYTASWEAPDVRFIAKPDVFSLENFFQDAKAYAKDLNYHGCRVFLYERLDTGAFQTLDVKEWLGLKTRPRVLNPSKVVESNND